MSTNVWHDAFKDPPKEEGNYLVYVCDEYSYENHPVLVCEYNPILCSFCTQKPRNGAPNWVFAEGNRGIQNGVWYWSELPDAPVRKDIVK